MAVIAQYIHIYSFSAILYALSLREILVKLGFGIALYDLGGLHGSPYD